MIKKILTYSFVLCGLIGHSQNNFGSLHSNFTPTNSVFVNPSSILDAKVWLDINVVGAGSYVNNNLIYLEDQNWFGIARDARRGTIDISEDDLQFNQSRRKYHAYNRNFVHALAGVWSQGDFAAGLSTGVRSYTDARGIPDYVAQFIENGVSDYTVQHDIRYELQRARVATSQFGEIKGTFAYTFLKRSRDMFMVGASISKFFPIAGGGANIYNVDFLVDNDSLISYNDFEVDAMYTPNPQFNTGKGWGLDLGFTYQRMLGEASTYYPNSAKFGCRENQYKYKIGVSIMDLGSIKFPEDQILYAGYNFSNFNWEDYQDAEANEDNATDIFAQQENNIAQGNVRQPNKMSLPTFISAQLDYNVWASRIYVNATWIQGIPAGRRTFGVRHANSLSVTPRYESPWIDFALPISLYEYRYPQLGAALRLGPLTIGTDKLISWFANTNLYGADIYVHLKIPILSNPKCKGRFRPSNGQTGRKGKKWKNCEAYGG
ncbi:MAG: hypothetical protein Crog4KO_10270 [Crocinitomicaceae bacterium]